MNRSYIILIIAILSYFGVTSLTEFLNPDVKNLSSNPTIKLSDLNINRLPDEMIGTFTIDTAGSTSLLNKQNMLNNDSKEYYNSLFDMQKKIILDNEKIQFEDQQKPIPFEIVAVRENEYELNLTSDSNDYEGAHTFFLQLDENDGLLYSFHSHLKGAEKMFYKARYIKKVEQ